MDAPSFPFVPRLSVTDAANKYAERAGSAGAAYLAGAESTQVDPTQLAAAQAQKAATNYAAAIADGRFQRGLARAGKAGWLQGIREKGTTNYATGVTTTGKRKWGEAMNQWFPIFDQLSAQIAQMPSNTPQDSINRVAAWINGTIAAKRQL